MRLIRIHKQLAVTVACLLGMAAVCAAADLKEEFHETYPLEKNGTIHLGNVNGNVRITTWDRDEVKVDAVKHAKEQAHLDAVKIEVDSMPDTLRIVTKYPESKKQRNNSVNVDYTLTVPQQVRLDKISTVNGGVEIQNVRGDVKAESVNGPVTATGMAGQVGLSTVNGSVKATLSEVTKEVSLKSVNGSVTVALPPKTSAEVSASTMNGGINSDLPLQIKTQFPLGRKVDGKLGEGGPKITMSSVNGGLRIDKANP